jgi:hypothetical protein
MKTFTDTEARDWHIAINAATLRAVRDSIPGVDLMNPMAAETEGGQPLIGRLQLDVILFVDVLYCLCKAQATERELTDEQFAAALGGETCRAAYDATVEELTDFFREIGRKDVVAILDKQRTVTERTLDAAEEAIHKAAEKVIEKTIEEIGKVPDTVAATIGKHFSSLPAS